MKNKLLEICITIKELIFSTAKHLYFWLFVVFSTVSDVVILYLWPEFQSQVGFVSMYVLCLAVFISIFHAYHTLRMNKKKLELKNSNLEIIYEAKAPYIQLQDMNNVIYRLFRIAIKNPGSKYSEKVKGKLISIDPPVQFSEHLPKILHVMNDNVNAPRFKEEIDLRPGEMEFIDVIAKHEPKNPNDIPNFNFFYIEHIVSDVDKKIYNLTKCVLTVSAQGRETRESKKSFSVFCDNQGKLHFEEAKQG